MSLVCSRDDAVYRIYETHGNIESASEYRRDVYANALDCFIQIQRHVKKLFSVY